MKGLWIGFTAVTVTAQGAQAAPWLRGDGEGYGRVAAAGERVEGIDAQRYDAYGEYGLGEKWTVTAKAELVTFPGNTDFNAEGYRATLRRELFGRGAFVLSAEAGAVYGEAIGGANTGCDTLGGEARLGAGASGEMRGAAWYGYVDVAYREHGQGCQRERVELGFGQEVAPNVYVVSQAFLERGTDDARSDKIETGILYRQGHVDWSLSYRQETSGRFEEEGIIASVAVRF
ncbi:MAG: hypothetical protein AAF253_01920 [Pseudomonadota bacterium]